MYRAQESMQTWEFGGGMRLKIKTMRLGGELQLNKVHKSLNLRLFKADHGGQWLLVP
jgi:hypothetical protein